MRIIDRIITLLRPSPAPPNPPHAAMPPSREDRVLLRILAAFAGRRNQDPPMFDGHAEHRGGRR
jgi:hypothetical protein